MRLFLAIDLSDNLKNQISLVQNQLKQIPKRVKWVEKENLHITAQFLGKTPQEKIQPLINALHDSVSNIGPFILEFNELKLIPNSRRPRVIALSLGGNLETLTNWQKEIQKRLVGIGFELDKEKTPHLTLGRIKDKGGIDEIYWQKKIEKQLKSLGFLEVNSAVIFQSILNSSGPVYKKIEEVKL